MYRYISIWGEGGRGGLQGSLYNSCFLFMKTEKVQERYRHYNQILQHFELIFFPRMNNKKI